MTKIFSTRVLATAIVAASAVGFGISQADASIIYLDVRATSVNGSAASDMHNVTLAPAGGTVNFSIYALVKDGDGNPANEGFELSQGNIYQAISTLGLHGNISGLVLSPQMSTMLSNLPAATANANGDMGYTLVSFATGITPITGGAASSFTPESGTWSEFLLGTATWTSTASPAGSSGQITYALRPSQKGSQVYSVNGTITTIATNSSGASAPSTSGAADNRIGTIALNIAVPNVGPTPQLVVVTTSSGTTTNTIDLNVAPAHKDPYFSPKVAVPAAAQNSGEIALTNLDSPTAMIRLLLWADGTIPTPGVGTLTQVGVGQTFTDPTYAAIQALFGGAYQGSGLGGPNAILEVPAGTPVGAGNSLYFDYTMPTGGSLFAVALVPEPASLGLLALGGLGLLARRRR